MPELYIGLMSGTSLDGIDAGLVEFIDGNIILRGFEYTPFSDELRSNIQNLSHPASAIRLIDYGVIDNQLGQLFAQACMNLLQKSKVSASAVTAIGSHGQTIYHAPEKSSAFSLQIGDPNIIAEETGITTVADFRRRDIAAGGQGAPLVPAFHQAIFGQIFDLSKQNISIVNIGGIANLTYLSSYKTIGFDTGPGNTLIDFWTKKHLDNPYDKDGAWAKTGKVSSKLVNNFKEDPYFRQSIPKSTGKEYFSSSWLDKKLTDVRNCCARDIQASLCQLTAETITDAIQQHAPLTDHTLICGGGIHNSYLIGLISKNLNHPVSSTKKFGINPDCVEAMAFAWLARQSMNNLPGNLMEVTGAKQPVILGGIYPGRNGLN
ncbi:MAG: anhydro-N-acetylmuramic acid kinase [Methylococcales bacterium]